MEAIYGDTRIRKKSRECRARYYDCRRYIAPGDRIRYFSEWKDAKFDKFRDPAVGLVVSVYRKFVLVLTPNGLVEGVNRWDIFSVGGMRVSDVGSFYGLPTINGRNYT